MGDGGWGMGDGGWVERSLVLGFLTRLKPLLRTVQTVKLDRRETGAAFDKLRQPWQAASSLAELVEASEDTAPPPSEP